MYRNPTKNSLVINNTSLEEFQMQTVQVKMVLADFKFFEGIGFIFLAMGFIVIGASILFALKSNFMSFYNKYRVQIVLATLFLGLPQAVLAILNIRIGMDQNLDP